MPDKRKILAVIVGPTAVGKTAVSIKLAQHFHTEIISADSRQIFHELNIGVARPSPSELSAVPHHFIGTISVQDDYNAGRFEADALAKLDELFADHQVVVCCGGSMMYVDAITKGFDDLPSDTEVRNRLTHEYRESGLESIQRKLRELDPEYYTQVDINNPHRVIRALEVCMISGKKYSDLRKENYRPREFDVMMFGLTARRNWIYKRINDRVDEMMKSGLEQEARELYPHRNLNALNTVGYKELFEFFDGKMTLAEAVEKIKQHSRNFAKRQLTWWKRDERIQWVEADVKSDPLDYIIGRIEERMK